MFHMSKKIAYIISAVLLVLLMILFICEIKNPEAGSTLLMGMVH